MKAILLQLKSTKHSTRLKEVSLLALLFLMTASLFAQDKKEYLSARESEPSNFGWMAEFPPSNEKTVSAKDGSYLHFPEIRWSVVNMRKLMPTTEISKKLATPQPFSYDLDENIDELTFLPWGEKDTMTWKESLDKNYTDGMLILHKGKIVYEDYFSVMNETKVHAVFSVTKSFVGTLAGILIAEGKLDETKTASYYVPELKNSAFGDATVRQILDMTTSVEYSEDYEDPDAEVWEFSDAGNALIKSKGDKEPVGYYAFLETVKKKGPHGQAFKYKTVNAQAAAWIVTRAAGKSIAELLSERIWTKIGMEQEGNLIIDAKGIPFSGDGLNASLRDLARFGELMRNKGNWKGEQLFPKEVAENIMAGASKEDFAKSDHPGLKGWSYKNLWWITENENEAYAARGVYGQTIYIDPAAEMVIVRLASYPVAANAANDAHSLPAYQAVADYLKKKD